MGSLIGVAWGSCDDCGRCRYDFDGDRSVGMFNNGSSPTVTNCTFSGNTASNSGGGMYNRPDMGNPLVTNTGFCGNTPDEIAGDPINDGGGNSLLYCPPPVAVCPADIDGDGNVGINDFLTLLQDWGPCE